MNLLRDYALSFVGRPYRWGGDDPMAGFDCSGFVQELLASAGMDPPGDQTAQTLYNFFENTGQRNVHTTGALAFFGESVTKITHVAMLLDAYRMIEAGGGGSKTTSLEAAELQNAYVRVRTIRSRKDLVAILKPRYAQIGVI